METTAFAMNDVETLVVANQDSPDSVDDFVALDEAQLRHVGGGMFVTINY